MKTRKKEIVFLPYLASMWGSMASVWKAASQDEDCHAVVIPIPYYSVNSDGSLGEFHNEGALFPPEVPIVNWETYDLEAMHPDIIYFHNPYDDENLITCVHSNFFSSRLVKCTDCLVYLPYAHLCEISCNASIFTKGFFAADHIVLPSETMRKFILKQLERELHNDKQAVRIMDSKMAILGSPKLDLIINAKKEDYPLPQGWLERIQGRTVVLYNTALRDSLDLPTAFLKKLLSTFTFFSSHPEYVLWWRPHPLLDQQLSAMSPECVSSYRQLVALFKSKNLGIYDDTPDSLPSMIYSDMYYGTEGSSFYDLYQATGKPAIPIRQYAGQFTASFLDDLQLYLNEAHSDNTFEGVVNADGTAGAHIHAYFKCMS